MADPLPVFVIDSFALLAHFEGETGGAVVRDLLEQAANKQVQLAMSLINAGEVYYITSREQGDERAQEVLEDLRILPVQFYEATERRILDAAQIKAHHSISYADSFAVALAQELHAKLVTGDPEFHALELVIEIMWLPSRTAQR
jgi:predicted nucleic acid-binding protein